MDRRYARTHVARTGADLDHHNTLVLGVGSHISVLLRSNSGAVSLRNRRYNISLEDGQVLEGTTDADGLIYHPRVPPGDYAAEVEGLNGRVVIPTSPTTMERRELRIPGYFLFDSPAGEDDLPEVGGDKEVVERQAVGGCEA